MKTAETSYPEKLPRGGLEIVRRRWTHVDSKPIRPLHSAATPMEAIDPTSDVGLRLIPLGNSVDGLGPLAESSRPMPITVASARMRGKPKIAPPIIASSFDRRSSAAVSRSNAMSNQTLLATSIAFAYRLDHKLCRATKGIAKTICATHFNFISSLFLCGHFAIQGISP